MPTSWGPNATEPSGKASDGRRTRGWRTPPSTWRDRPASTEAGLPERPGSARAGSALARLGHEERALADDLQPSRAVHAGGHHGHDRGSCAARCRGRRGEQGHEPRHGRQGQSSKPSSCRSHRAPPERSVGPVTYRTRGNVKPAATQSFSSQRLEVMVQRPVAHLLALGAPGYIRRAEMDARPDAGIDDVTVELAGELVVSGDARRDRRDPQVDAIGAEHAGQRAGRRADHGAEAARVVGVGRSRDQRLPLGVRGRVRDCRPSSPGGSR